MRVCLVIIHFQMGTSDKHVSVLLMITETNQNEITAQIYTNQSNCRGSLTVRPVSRLNYSSIHFFLWRHFIFSFQQSDITQALSYFIFLRTNWVLYLANVFFRPPPSLRFFSRLHRLLCFFSVSLTS